MTNIVDVSCGKHFKQQTERLGFHEGSAIIEKLENDKLFWSASSLRSSIDNVLWFRFNREQLHILDSLKFTCLGHIMLNADMLKQNSGRIFNTHSDSEYFSNNIANIQGVH